MPWSNSNYPPAFKNLPAKPRAKAIAQAEAIRKSCVADGGDEERCSRTAIATALRNVKAEGIDVQGIQLAEPRRLSQIKENFDAGVYGIDVAVDINHDHRSGAAGWIKSLEVGPSSTQPEKSALFAQVEWTDHGREMVGRYKYISAEFGPYTDPETGKTTQDVLKAATLTNRPFIKGMQPVAVEEERIEVLREGDYIHPILGDLVITTEEPETSEVDHMNLEEALRGLGIELEDGEDAATKLTETVTSLRDEIADLKEKLAEVPPVTAEEVQEKNVELEELNSQVVKLSETVKALETSNQALSAKLFEAERDAFLEAAVQAGKVLPKELDGYKKLYAADKEATVALIETLDPKVDLETHGSDEGKEMTLEEKVLAKADELQKSDTDLSVEDAILQADKLVRGDA